MSGFVHVDTIVDRINGRIRDEEHKCGNGYSDKQDYDRAVGRIAGLRDALKEVDRVREKEGDDDDGS